ERQIADALAHAFALPDGIGRCLTDTVIVGLVGARGHDGLLRFAGIPPGQAMLARSPARRHALLRVAAQCPLTAGRHLAPPRCVPAIAARADFSDAKTPD